MFLRWEMADLVTDLICDGVQDDTRVVDFCNSEMVNAIPLLNTLN